MAVDEEVKGESENVVNEEESPETENIVNKEVNGKIKNEANEESNGEIKNAVSEEVNDESKKVVKGEVKAEVSDESKDVVNEEPKDVVIKKKFFTPIKIIIILAIIVAVVGGSVFYYAKATKEKALKAEQVYMVNLKVEVLLVSVQGSKIETDTQAIASVWNDAIYNAPVMVNGNYAYTFDDALQYKNDEFKSNGEMDSLIKGKANIQKSMDALSNPPSKDKEAYESVMKIFDSYNQFETMVESPTGSLTDYNQQFNTLDSSLVSQMKDFNTRYPN